MREGCTQCTGYVKMFTVRKAILVMREEFHGAEGRHGIGYVGNFIQCEEVLYSAVNL